MNNPWNKGICTKVIVECDYCGCPTKKYSYDINKSKSGKVFCCRKCYYEFLRVGKVETICPTCNKKHYVKRSIFNKSKKDTICCSLKCRGKYYSGNNSPNFGREQTEETKEKNRKSHVGKKRTKEQIEKHRKSIMGSNNGSWKGGITIISQIIRGLPEYKQWRISIFERDNFTCQRCSIGRRLEAHHWIKRFSIILCENNIKTCEDAIKCGELWDICNGITLCKKCHKIKHSNSCRG